MNPNDRTIAQTERSKIIALRKDAKDPAICRFIECYYELSETAQWEIALLLGRLRFGIRRLGTGGAMELLLALMKAGEL